MKNKKKDNNASTLSRKPDKEDKQNYFKMVNKKVVQLRMSPNELALLQTMMHKFGAENTSAFIRYKLFGIDPDRKINELIKRKETDDLVILLRNQILDLTEYFIYYYNRYEKDMSQLWKEEGVNMKDWVSATNRWHAEVAKRTQEVLTICRKIAQELKIEEYFEMPSSKMNIDTKNASTEELDALAEQLRKEAVAMGRPVQEL